MFKSIQLSAILMALGILAIAASAVMADDTQTLQVGAKVRATVPREVSADIPPSSGKESTDFWLEDFETKPLKTEKFTNLTGTILGLDETTLTLEVSPDEPPVKIQMQDISKLELFKGTRSGDAGGWIGFGVGAAMGYLMGKTSGDDPPSGEIIDFSMSAETKAGFGAVVFGALGASIGSRIHGGDVWEEVPTNNLQLGLTKGSHGEMGFILSARF